MEVYHKLIKTVEYDLPEGYVIKVFAKYRRAYVNYLTVMEDAVETIVNLYKDDEIELSTKELIAKPEPTGFLFLKKKPKYTWRELVDQNIEYDIEYLKRKLNETLEKQSITDGLMDSLDNL